MCIFIDKSSRAIILHSVLWSEFLVDSLFYRYAIPLIEKILRGKSVSENSEGVVKAMVMVPSKELAEQATRNLKVVTFYRLSVCG